MLAPLLLVALAGQTPDAGARPSVLILPVEAAEQDRTTAQLVESGIAYQLSQQANLRVVTYKEISATLTQEQLRQVTGCAMASCAAEVAGALNSDEIVLASVAHAGKTLVFNASRVRARDANVMSRVSRSFGSVEEVVAGLPSVVAELFPTAPPQARAAAPGPDATTSTAGGGSPAQVGRLLGFAGLVAALPGFLVALALLAGAAAVAVVDVARGDFAANPRVRGVSPLLFGVGLGSGALSAVVVVAAVVAVAMSGALVALGVVLG